MSLFWLCHCMSVFAAYPQLVKSGFVRRFKSKWIIFLICLNCLQSVYYLQIICAWCNVLHRKLTMQSNFSHDNDLQMWALQTSAKTHILVKFDHLLKCVYCVKNVSVLSLRELFESKGSHIVIDFVKETHFISCHSSGMLAKLATEHVITGLLSCILCGLFFFTEGFLSKQFKYVYVQLYSDSHFVWYRSQYSSKPDGLVSLMVS